MEVSQLSKKKTFSEIRILSIFWRHVWIEHSASIWFCTSPMTLLLAHHTLKSFIFRLFLYIATFLTSCRNLGWWAINEPLGCSTTKHTPKASRRRRSRTILLVILLASRIFFRSWFPRGRPALRQLVPRLIGTQVEQGGAQRDADGRPRNWRHDHTWVRNPRSDKISAFRRNCSTQPPISRWCVTISTM